MWALYNNLKMLPYPNFDPIIASIGPLSLRWYGLAYLAGITLGIRWVYTDLKKIGLTKDDVISLATWIMTGIIIGGRIGYIVFYDLGYFIQNPSAILAIWTGGMSYHGGAIGAMVAMGGFARSYKKSLWSLLDCLGLASTIGIFFGRIANFINGELVGRVSAVPWAMVFPGEGPLPRHPSQLYEAMGEGLVLLIVLSIINKKAKLSPGQLFGLYLMGYGSARFSLEFFREPDPQIGLLFGLITMGQLLSAVMISVGVATVLHLRRPYTLFRQK
jgi:phosphatidylglycerol:prolipoprotein diacylglycerol transferase